MKVSDLMRVHVTTVKADETARDAVDKMDLYQVSGLPVVDEEMAVVGLVSEHDVIKRLVPSYSTEGVGFEHNVDQLRDLAQDLAQQRVREFMTVGAVTVDENADALEAAKLMLQYRIKRIPVTSKGKLVGIISRIDICQAVLGGSM